MDDKNNNNQIIDFSNQPLGLMAQEGEQIENKLNTEQRLNSAAVNTNPNVQDNPFQDLGDSFGKPQEAPVDKIMMAMSQHTEETPAEAAPVETPQENPMPQEPVPTPTPEPVANPQPEPQMPINNENNKSIQPEVKPVASENNANSIPLPPQPKKEAVAEVEQSNGSFLMFFILVAIVVAAVVLFKTGKLDQILDSNKDNDETKEVASDNKKQEEQKEEEPVAPPVEEQEPIRNFQIKEVIFASFVKEKMTLTYTTTGIVDLENKATNYSVTININGMTSRSFPQYFDMKSGIVYTKNTYNASGKEWLKETADSDGLDPDALLALIKSTGSITEVSPGNYKATVTGSALTKYLNKNEYFNPKKIKNEKLVIEYSVENGRLTKAKFDFTKVYNDKNVQKMILSQEFTQINKNESVTIPQEVIKNAKKA